MSRTALLLTAGLLALSATACGRRGPLEQPAPLFSQGEADFEARRAAAQQAQEAQRNADGTAATRDTAQAPSPESDNDETADDFRVPRGDLRDPAQRLDPPSQAPISGNDPFGPPPSTRPNG